MQTALFHPPHIYFTYFLCGQLTISEVISNERKWLFRKAVNFDLDGVHLVCSTTPCLQTERQVKLSCISLHILCLYHSVVGCTWSAECSLVNTQVPLGSTFRFQPFGVLRSRLALGMLVRFTWLREKSLGRVGGLVGRSSS